MRKILAKKFFEKPALKVADGLLGKFLVRGGSTALGDRTAKAYMIIEVEAYDGFKDKASHAHRGRTLRNAPMFGEAGRWYVYFTYGMHWMLNIVTGPKDYPAAVLIRGVSGQTERHFPSQHFSKHAYSPAGELLCSRRRAVQGFEKCSPGNLTDKEAKNLFAGLASRPPRGLRSSREESKKVAWLPLNGPAKLTKFLKIDKRFNNLPANRKTGFWIEDRGVSFPASRIQRTARIGVGYAQEWAKKKMRFIIEE